MTFKIIIATTVPDSLFFHWREITLLKNIGFEVILLSSPGEKLYEFAELTNTIAFGVPMVRRISPFRDLLSLIRIFLLFVRLRPAILLVSTPKASTIALLAGTLARIPVKHYIVRGVMPEIFEGWRKKLLTVCEWMNCNLAHRVNPISFSVADSIINNKLCNSDKLRVYGQGGGEGINATDLFNPSVLKEDLLLSTTEKWREFYENITVGFCGRIAKDKGIRELLEAWEKIRLEFPELRLLFVGDVDSTSPPDHTAIDKLCNDPRIGITGFVDPQKMPYFYRLMDVLVLPTYREGFGMVLIEAGAMELPVVATKVTGCVDAVIDSVTGTLIPPKDAGALAEAITSYIRDPLLRISHGKAGRKKVLECFSEDSLLMERIGDYCSQLKAKGIFISDTSYL